jgi:hypothetical protein
MKAFDVAIEQMLWPEKREHDALLGTKVPGVIDRTQERSELSIPAGYVPDAVVPLQGALHRWFPWLVDSGGDITIGPIPKNVPVGLLANVMLLSESNDLSQKAEHAAKIVDLLVKLKHDLATASASATDEELLVHFANLKDPMLELSKCPDLVVNRGHYFGTAQFNDQDGLSADETAFGQEPVLSDDDKRALIAFLKTF